MARWPTIRLYQPPSLRLARLAPNMWDAAALALLFATLVGVAHGAREALLPIAALGRAPISLDPAMLPEYALRTTLRMFAAIAASLLFTFTVATLAAKNRKAELIIVPALDVLQSVPVLSFLTFTTVLFLGLFPGQVLGVELASIFAIFTAQAWNMAFSFYQSLKAVPADLVEASASFRLTGWQRFWRLEAPFAAPGLVWNTMLSMSGSWFFLTISEAITVGDTTIRLPGIGSYVAAALDAGDTGAIGYAVLAMFLVILAYDQLLFRPVVAWAEKFRFEQTQSGEPPRSWILEMVARARWITRAIAPVGEALRSVARWPLFPMRAPSEPEPADGPARTWGDRLWLAVVLALVAWAVWRIADYVGATLSWAEVGPRLEVRPLHTAARGGPDRARQPALGAGGRVDRDAAQDDAIGPARRPIPRRLSRQSAVPFRGRRHPPLRAERGRVALPPDGARHAVVHSLQRDRGGERLPGRSQGGLRQLWP